MAISSTIINDIIAGTSTLNITSGSNTIENIVFTNSNLSILFSIITSFSLSATDFLYFRKIIKSYFQNLVDVFNIPTQNYSSFSCYSYSDVNDGVNTLSCSYSKTVHPLYGITATYPLGSISFSHRTQSSNLTFDEFKYFLFVSDHFDSEVHQLFKV